MELNEQLKKIIARYEKENTLDDIIIGNLYLIHPLVALHSYIKIDTNLMGSFTHICIGKNKKVAFFYRPGEKIVELPCGFGLLDCKQI